MNKTISPKSSTNYAFCNFFLPQLYFFRPILFLAIIKEPNMFGDLMNIICRAMEDNAYDTTSLKNLNYWVKLDKESKLVGIIIEVPNPVEEPECNFVCLCFNKEPIVFESELFADGHFGLCGRTRNKHFITTNSFLDIRSKEDMWNVILKTKIG